MAIQQLVGGIHDVKLADDILFAQNILHKVFSDLSRFTNASDCQLLIISLIYQHSVCLLPITLNINKLMAKKFGILSNPPTLLKHILFPITRLTFKFPDSIHHFIKSLKHIHCRVKKLFNNFNNSNADSKSLSASKNHISILNRFIMLLVDFFSNDRGLLLSLSTEKSLCDWCVFISHSSYKVGVDFLLPFLEQIVTLEENRLPSERIFVVYFESTMRNLTGNKRCWKVIF